MSPALDQAKRAVAQAAAALRAARPTGKG